MSSFHAFKPHVPVATPYTSAIASGFFGDWLESRRNPLAVSLALLHSGTELDLAHPEIDNASGTLCISIHGLMELETVWQLPEYPWRKLRFHAFFQRSRRCH